MGWKNCRTFDKRAALVLDCAGEGNVVCRKLVHFSGECVGAAFASTANAVNLPDRFVIGGGVSNAPEAAKRSFFDGVVAGFRQGTWKAIAALPQLEERFVWARFGNLAGCIGMLPKVAKMFSEGK